MQVARTLVVDGLNEIDRQLRDIALRNLNGHVPQAILSQNHINKDALITRRATVYNTPCRQPHTSNDNRNGNNMPSSSSSSSAQGSSHATPEPVSSLSASASASASARRPSEVSSYASECSETTTSQRSERSRLSLPPTPLNRHRDTRTHHYGSASFSSLSQSSPSYLPPFELYHQHHRGGVEEGHQQQQRLGGGHGRNFSNSL
ncbi:hypothetical protein VTN77DRAFT_5495 [Rasamsonia byssochlamydoides]|uniref:uncharacterized protein n=1 Tax=Rasamsonia byssochlamydoides TaxID=89139 RepID=UPI003742DA11